MKDYIQENQMKVAYVPTKDMVADILTKPLQGRQFIKLRNKLLGLVPDCWIEEEEDPVWLRKLDVRRM